MPSLVEIVFFSCTVVGGSFTQDKFDLISTKGSPMEMICSATAENKSRYSCILKLSSDATSFSKSGTSSLPITLTGFDNGKFGMMFGSEALNEIMQIKRDRAIYQSRSLLEDMSTVKVCVGKVKTRR